MTSLTRVVVPVAFTVVFFAAGVAGLLIEARQRIDHTGNQMGVLGRVDGGVQYRSSGVPIWTYGVTGLRLFENDLVATGDGAGATIDLRDGQRLELGPNTVVALAKVQTARHSEHTVNLVSGLLKVGVAPSKRPDLVVKVGSHVLKTGIEPLAISATPIFGQRGPLITVLPPDAALRAGFKTSPPARSVGGWVHLAAAGEAVLRSVSAPQPAPPAPLPQSTLPASVSAVPSPPAPNLDIKDPALAPPELVWPVNGATLWAAGSMTGASAVPPLELRLKSVGPTGAIAVAELPSGGSVATLRSGAPGKDQSIQITSDQVAKLSVALPTGGRRLGFRLGTELGKALGESRALGVNLRSLADLEAAPPAIFLADLHDRPTSDHWTVESATVTEQTADATIRLFPGQGSGRLRRAVLSAERFAIGRGGNAANGELYAVRSGMLVGTVSLRQPSPEAWARLRNVLNVDFIYRGTRAALVAGFVHGQWNSRTSLPADVGSNVLYILHSGQIVTIDRKVLTDDSALTLVKQNAEAVFREPVTIVAFK